MDTNTTPKNSLAARIARVMLKINRLPKSGHNREFGYKYVQDEDVLDTLRPLLAEEGIMILASADSVEQTTVTTSTGKSTIHTLVHFTFTMICETGEMQACKWVGEANDSGDKGVSKAATLAQKYWLLKTFLLSSGDPTDDPDSGVLRKKAQADADTESTSTRPHRNRPTAAKNGSASSAAHWYQDAAEIKRVAQAIAPKSPTQAANVLGKTLPDFDSADALISAWQQFNAPAQPAKQDQREGEPQSAAVPFDQAASVVVAPGTPPWAGWWHDPESMRRVAEAVAPMTPDAAAWSMNTNFANHKGADDFIAMWRELNTSIVNAMPKSLVTSTEPTFAETRARLNNEFVRITRLDLMRTKKGTTYWVAPSKDPNGTPIQVKFWAEHIAALERAGWPFPIPDANDVDPESVAFDEPLEITLDANLRPASIPMRQRPTVTVTRDELKPGDVFTRGNAYCIVLENAGEYPVYVRLHLLDGSIYMDGNQEALSLKDAPTTTYDVWTHPHAKRLLQQRAHRLEHYRRTHPHRYATQEVAAS